MIHATWKPISDLFQIHDGMDKMFEDFFGGKRSAPSQTAGTEWDWVPSVDILEAGDRVEIRAELPGVSSEEVTISVMDDTLTLKGKKKQVEGADEDTYHRAERSYGRFNRAFKLPANLQAESVEAKFKDGVLTISLPKAEKAKPTEVEIKTE